MGSVIRSAYFSPDYSKNSKGFLRYLWFSFLKAKQSTLKLSYTALSASETVVSFVNYTNSSWRIFQQVLSLSSQKEHLPPKWSPLIPKVHILTALTLDTFKAHLKHQNEASNSTLLSSSWFQITVKEIVKSLFFSFNQYNSLRVQTSKNIHIKY